MWKTLLTFVVPASFVLFGCMAPVAESKIHFVEERDILFKGVSKQVSIENGFLRVLYYYEDETMGSLVERVERAEFFRTGGWTEWKKSKDGVMVVASRQLADKSRPNLLFIYQGKEMLDGEVNTHTSGATLVFSSPVDP
ncbi:MAG: hypothetical protein ACK5ZK_00565 [Armatimonadota bacterium]|jgi:hypothetical protein